MKAASQDIQMFWCVSTYFFCNLPVIKRNRSVTQDHHLHLYLRILSLKRFDRYKELFFFWAVLQSARDQYFFFLGLTGPSFAFKDYAPQVFRSLRGVFGIDTADYMVGKKRKKKKALVHSEKSPTHPRKSVTHSGRSLTLVPESPIHSQKSPTHLLKRHTH